MPAGEPVAFDGRGQPIIVRQVESETGKVRTVVRNEEGVIRAFGEVTVSSLAESEEQDAKRWVDGLSDRELRALVHEVGHRLLWNSKQYESHQAELEKMVDAYNYTYFGLEVGAPEKALDNAYRKLAKKMHPDKNGGTEDAKQRFQQMKERYEALKTRRNPEERKEKKNDKDQAEEDRGTEDQEAEGEERKKAGDENDEAVVDRQDQQNEEPKSTIEYDPNDRQSLHKTIWRMLSQLKTMQKGLQDLVKQLGRVNAQNAQANAGLAASM